jgi:DNA-binding CsgD family transcriptional regulator
MFTLTGIGILFLQGYTMKEIMQRHDISNTHLKSIRIVLATKTVAYLM